MDLTVIIATRDRCAILRETLARLESQRDDAEFEVVVVDDGSADGTIEMLREEAATLPFALTLIEQPSLGPAAARNRALAVAQAPVCLFIDDDTWPGPQLLRRHADFHRRHPEREAALLGFVDVAPDPAPTPFMRWMAGLHLGFHAIENPDDAGGRHFFTGNASAKTDLLRSVGGFDENYPSAGHEDIDLGLRLEEQGMRLAYDPQASVDHYHPADLPGAIRRMRDVGTSLAISVERHPTREVPRRPGLRHRVKAAGLTALALARVRTRAVQRETWRFLCHESTREGFWDAMDTKNGRSRGSGDRLRIGRTLARLASRDEDAQLPAADERFDRRPAASKSPAIP